MVGVVDYAEVDLVLEDLDVSDLLCTEPTVPLGAWMKA